MADVLYCSYSRDDPMKENCVASQKGIARTVLHARRITVGAQDQSVWEKSFGADDFRFQVI